VARLKLYRSQTTADDLPPVCMACGRPAVTYLNRTFSWSPWWASFVAVILLLTPLHFLSVVIAREVTKEITISAPVCPNHLGYWSRRRRWLGLSILFLFLCWVGVFAFAELMPGLGKNEKDMLEDAVLYGGPGSFVAWLVVALVVHFQSVRAVSVTDRSVTLAGVSPEFVSFFFLIWEAKPDDQTRAE
jgi:hypothetical protein